MFRYKYSTKFYLGLIILILSLILGKVGLYYLVFFNKGSGLFWLGVFIYLVSWPLTIWGVWWVGIEYADKIKKFISYKFYTQSLTRGTKRVVRAGATGTKTVGRKVKSGALVIGGHMKRKSVVLGSRVKNRLKKRNKPS